jgi:hypothetical protein
VRERRGAAGAGGHCFGTRRKARSGGTARQRPRLHADAGKGGHELRLTVPVAAVTTIMECSPSRSETLASGMDHQPSLIADLIVSNYLYQADTADANVS